MQTPDLGWDPFINFLLNMVILPNMHFLPIFWTLPYDESEDARTTKAEHVTA